MVINLPEWNLTLCPPLYDTESKSCIEQTAQVYAKMREVVENHNKFTKEMRKTIDDHINNVYGDMSDFKKEITCLMNKYIASVDSELDLIHNHLHELLKNYERDVVEQTRNIIEEGLNNGTITIFENYDEATESLYFTVGGEI